MPEADSRHTTRRRQAAFAALAEVLHPDLRPLTSQQGADRLLGLWWRADDIENLQREIQRLQDAKRRALAIADERSKEAVALRLENERLRAELDGRRPCA